MPPKQRKGPKREPIDSPDVRRIMPRQTLEVLDMIAEGHATEKEEEAIYLITLDLQRGFNDLARQREAVQRDLDHARRMEEDVRRLLSMVEDQQQRRRPPPRDRSYGGYRDGGYRDGGSRYNSRPRSPPPPREYQGGFMESAGYADDDLRPSSPGYTPTQPPEPSSIGSLLNSLQPKADRPYSPTTAS